MNSTPSKLSKAERLAIGSAVAATVRQQAKAPRVVHLVDKDGKPVGITTSTEVAKSLLARSEIEFSVQMGTRPQYVTCKDCGWPIKITSQNTPTRCRKRTHKCRCGAVLVGRNGRCMRGVLCLRCRAQDRRKPKPPPRPHFQKVSEAQLRAAFRCTTNAAAAARALGITAEAARTRAQRLGIIPPNGSRASVPTARIRDALATSTTYQEAADKVGLSVGALFRRAAKLHLQPQPHKASRGGRPRRPTGSTSPGTPAAPPARCPPP